MPLRGKLVRLAHANPELRPHLLPLICKTAAGKSLEMALEPAIDRYRKLIHKHIAKSLLKHGGGRFTDIQADDRGCRFKAKGIDSSIVVFIDIGKGRKGGMEVRAEIGGKVWHNANLFLKMGVDVSEVAEDALYAIPIKVRGY